ncbi:hypothetical protein BD626DRAFT_585345 [Schizophyllum amplum]|uniref:Uncharacterized protein n=1 Tax=Schizophyllum amplum TaxID=97359 RepID=A0A550C5L9_9AGAR|nr:hypothetical protein BD626DRAFT_585345 [Auriculariopsis ampla]
MAAAAAPPQPLLGENFDSGHGDYATPRPALAAHPSWFSGRSTSSLPLYHEDHPPPAYASGSTSLAAAMPALANSSPGRRVQPVLHRIKARTHAVPRQVKTLCSALLLIMIVVLVICSLKKSLAGFGTEKPRAVLYVT